QASAPVSRGINGGSFERQTSAAIGQRGWKRQPAGKARGLGTTPGIENSSPLNASTLSVPFSNPWVYGWRGRANSAWISFVSTTRPAYITYTRSQTSAT